MKKPKEILIIASINKCSLAINLNIMQLDGKAKFKKLQIKTNC
jgi:hypothetical protein